MKLTVASTRLPCSRVVHAPSRPAFAKPFRGASLLLFSSPLTIDKNRYR